MIRCGWWLALMAQAALAATPVITELQPRGAEIGRAFTLTLVGRNIGEGARILSTLPAALTLVTPSQKPGMMMMAPGRAVSFLVEPKSGAQPGVYPIRVETSAGISNILLFTLGTFPEVTEEESQPYSPPNRNDSIETAEPIRQTPVVVNGTLRGPERDVYRAYGKGGERRVFEVEARRIGSAVDPVLRILDASGRQLARSDDSAGAGLDARIDFTFPKEGNYYVEVTDARFSAQTQNFYRLKMGSYAYADGVFPLGGRRGDQTPVTFFGGRAGADVKSVADLRGVAKPDAFTRVAEPDSPALPFLFAVSDLPEVSEPVEVAPVPGVVNGRLEKDGEVDRYRVKVAPGEKLLFELQARELGTSRLEGIITVYDAAGKKLDSAGDKPLPEDVFAIQGISRTSSDPFLNLTAPSDARELTVTVEDLALRGGPLFGYRLIIRRQAEDFTLSIGAPYVNLLPGGTVVIPVSADRRGYDGPIQLTISDPPKGVHVEGGMIPREYMDANNQRTLNRTGVLLVTADADAALPEGRLQVWGEGKLADGTTFRRQARGLGMVESVAGATDQGVVDRQRPVTAAWLGLDLPAGLTEPAPATLEVQQTSLKQMEEGVRYEFAYKWNLRTRGTPPPQIGVDVIGARDVRIIDRQPSADAMSGTFVVTTTKATDPARYDLYVSGRLKTDEGEESIVSRPLPFEVTGGTSSVASNR